MSMSKQPSPEKQNYGRFIDLGLQFAIAIALGLFGGWYLDSKLDTLPLFVVLGTLVGAASGFVSIYRVVYPPKAENSKSDEKTH